MELQVFRPARSHIISMAQLHLYPSFKKLISNQNLLSHQPEKIICGSVVMNIEIRTFEQSDEEVVVELWKDCSWMNPGMTSIEIFRASSICVRLRSFLHVRTAWLPAAF